MFNLVAVFFVVQFMQVALAEPDCAAVDTSEPPRECVLREFQFDSAYWNYYAGFYCYNYTNNVRLTKRYKIGVEHWYCNNSTIVIPTAMILDELNVTFNYQKTKDLYYIRKSFKNDEFFNNYISCCKEAEYCCNFKMNIDNIKPSPTKCPAIWDAWSCFPPTPVNTTAKLPCSSQAYQSPDQVCTLESEKKCIWNEATHLAEWNQITDYTVCAIAPVYEKRYNFHIIFLGICIGVCIPAICIFFVFEKLRNTVRVILHRNLLIAICVRNVCTIMAKKLVILDALKGAAESHHRLENNGVGCRILAFFETSSINAIYACMFLDAYYLHKVIVRAFAKETKMVHVYTTLLIMTFVFSFCWAMSLYAVDAQNCWMVDQDNLQWVVDGFRIAILVINTVLLFDIIRVMILKLKHGSTTKQTMAAFRATIFLIPLFGLHILVTAKKIVINNTCAAEDAYNYARYSMEALQGIIVSVLFCYANNEVRGEVKNGYRKTCIFLNQKFGWNLGGDLLYDRRRATTATFVPEAYH